MSPFVRRLLLAGAALIPIAAQAMEWNFMLKADKKETLAFIDMSSYVKLGGKIGLRSMLMRREDSIMPNTISAMTYEEIIDCKAKTIQLLGETSYGNQMRLIKFNKVNEAPEVVRPNSFGKAKLDIVCDKKFDPNKRSFLYMPVESDVIAFRNHFVEQERATQRAIERAQAEAAGLPPPPPAEPPFVFNRK